MVRILKWVRCSTGSQCRRRSRVEESARLSACRTRQAAVFWTRWDNFFISSSGRPARIPLQKSRHDKTVERTRVFAAERLKNFLIFPNFVNLVVGALTHGRDVQLNVQMTIKGDSQDFH